MQKYVKSAKELLDNVAKLTIRQDALQQRPAAPQLLQASSSPVAPRPSVPIESRVSRFKQELLASRINLDELRRLAFQGIPDKDGLRAMTWKVRLHQQQDQQDCSSSRPCRCSCLCSVYTTSLPFEIASTVVLLLVLACIACRGCASKHILPAAHMLLC
jgi:hypothetical protein